MYYVYRVPQMKDMKSAFWNYYTVQIWEIQFLREGFKKTCENFYMWGSHPFKWEGGVSESAEISTLFLTLP